MLLCALFVGLVSILLLVLQHVSIALQIHFILSLVAPRRKIVGAIGATQVLTGDPAPHALLANTKTRRGLMLATTVRSTQSPQQEAPLSKIAPARLATLVPLERLVRNVRPANTRRQQDQGSA